MADEKKTQPIDIPRAEQSTGKLLGKVPSPSEEVLRRSFYTPLKPALDELKQQTAPVVESKNNGETAKASPRPMTPISSMMIKTDY